MDIETMQILVRLEDRVTKLEQALVNPDPLPHLAPQTVQQMQQALKADPNYRAHSELESVLLNIPLTSPGGPAHTNYRYNPALSAGENAQRWEAAGRPENDADGHALDVRGCPTTADAFAVVMQAPGPTAAIPSQGSDVNIEQG